MRQLWTTGLLHGQEAHRTLNFFWGQLVKCGFELHVQIWGDLILTLQISHFICGHPQEICADPHTGMDDADLQIRIHSCNPHR